MDPWELPIPPMFDTDALIAASLPQIFKSHGGKHYVAKTIAAKIPPNAVYCEPFAGSAAVFWARDPSPREVLSDLRDLLIDTFRFIRDAEPADLERFRKLDWRPSRKRFDYLRRWKPTSLIGKAYKFIWISRATLLNQENAYYSPTMARRNLRPPSLDRLNRWHDRLQGVTLLQRDAFKVIEAEDSPFTSFYLDPPYPRGRHPNLYPIHDFNTNDLNRLVQLLKHIKGKFVLSLNLDSVPEKLPSFFRVQRMKILYPSLPTSAPHLKLSREAQFRFEALVMNF